MLTSADTEPTGLSILIVDDEDSTRRLCRDIAVDAALQAHTTGTTEQALELLEETPVDIVLTDLKVPEVGGMELLKLIRSKYPHVAVMMLTQFSSIETAITATRLGALDYIAKPFHVDELRRKFEELMHHINRQEQNCVLRQQLRTRSGFEGLIGTSEKMQRIYRVIERVRHHNYPVLVVGESGTGKELVARSIHFSGARKNKTFVPVDCAGLVPTLIESELFGYVRGAFTGAQQSRVGLIETANGGTLFLDEIGELPVDLQAKLLRVLQERELRPVGASHRVPVDVRIIAATNRDLETAIRTGGFRQDLYYRLNVVQIKLPPLREHKSDIPLLVHYFLNHFSEEQDSIGKVSEDVMRCFMSYDWVGNVRELENAVEHAVALGSGPLLHVGDLPSNLQQYSNEEALDSNELTTLDEVERRFIFRALREANGDKLAAARLLGMGKTTLYRKLKQYRAKSEPN
jgi:DNA-binding NtrC family response regulator